MRHEPPDNSPPVEELVKVLEKHYASIRDVGFETLPLEVRVRSQIEANELERKLFEHDSKVGFPLVRKLCSSIRATSRFAAMMILYRRRPADCDVDPSVTDLLLTRLRMEDDPETMQQIILWFRYQRKDHRAVRVLRGLASHPDRMVRICVVDALGAYLGDVDARDALYALLLDADPGVREAAEEELRIKPTAWQN
jgi:hypothetical protein